MRRSVRNVVEAASAELDADVRRQKRQKKTDAKRLREEEAKRIKDAKEKRKRDLEASRQRRDEAYARAMREAAEKAKTRTEGAGVRIEETDETRTEEAEERMEEAAERTNDVEEERKEETAEAEVRINEAEKERANGVALCPMNDAEQRQNDSDVKRLRNADVRADRKAGERLKNAVIRADRKADDRRLQEVIERIKNKKRGKEVEEKKLNVKEEEPDEPDDEMNDDETPTTLVSIMRGIANMKNGGVKHEANDDEIDDDDVNGDNQYGASSSAMKEEGECSESEPEEDEEEDEDYGKQVRSSRPSPSKSKKDKTELTCPLCSKVVIGMYGLEHHFRRDHKNEDIPSVFACDACDKSYRRYSCLQKHKRLIHQRKVNTKRDGEVSCPVCASKFSGNYVLSDHLRLEHEEIDIRPFSCDVCDLQCRTANALRNHKKKHLPARGEFHCEICDMRFPKFTGLERHQKQRHGSVSESTRAMQPKEHGCPCCEERFSYQSHLDRHLETKHVDDAVGTFECSDCDRLFKTHRAMIAHRKTHTTTVSDARQAESGHRFPCDLCARRFEKWEGLIFHQRQVHQTQTEGAKALENLIDYGVRCPMCEAYFRGNHALSEHVQKEHPDFDGILFSCDECGLGFKHYARLRQHRTHKHGVPVKFKQGYLKKNPELRKARELERRKIGSGGKKGVGEPKEKLRNKMSGEGEEGDAMRGEDSDALNETVRDDDDDDDEVERPIDTTWRRACAGADVAFGGAAIKQEVQDDDAVTSDNFRGYHHIKEEVDEDEGDRPPAGAGLRRQPLVGVKEELFDNAVQWNIKREVDEYDQDDMQPSSSNQSMHQPSTTFTNGSSAYDDDDSNDGWRIVEEGDDEAPSTLETSKKLEADVKPGAYHTNGAATVTVDAHEVRPLTGMFSGGERTKKQPGRRPRAKKIISVTADPSLPPPLVTASVVVKGEIQL